MITLRSAFRSTIRKHGYLLNELKDGGRGRILKPFSTSAVSFQCADSTGSETVEYPPNSSIVPISLNNRNPRNLEKLRIGDKPVGWTLEKDGRSFWNKVVLEITGKHVIASIQHFEGTVPVQASTLEWCIKKQLYSTKDVSAVRTVGQVLAQRCLHSGIHEVYCYFTEEQLAKEKVKVFIKALEEGGLTLTEPDQLPREEYVHLNYPYIHTKAWEVFEELDEKFLSKIEAKQQPSPNSSTS